MAFKSALIKVFSPFRPSLDFDCRQAEETMSAYIDSMSTDEESRHLEDHIAVCSPCRRQLRGYVSLRGFVSGIAVPEVPEDLALEARIRLSHARSDNLFEQLGVRMTNVLRPRTIPALAGVVMTLACFALLLGNIGGALALPADSPESLWAHTQQARAKGPLMLQLSELGLDELTVDLNIDQTGKPLAAIVMNGGVDPKLNEWFRDVVLLADFYPATVRGRPVPSRLILSFVGVKS